jgi:lysozyme
VIRRRALVLTSMAAMIVAACASREGRVETVADHLPAGEMLEPVARGLIPEGVSVRTVFPDALQLTKASEGWRPRLYHDAAGYCTIGYGHLVARMPCSSHEPVEFRNGLTLDQGETLLKGDLTSAQYTVMTAVSAPMTDGQFGALVDFVFNVGSGNFRTSTLLRVVNAGEIERVEGQFKRWVLANGKEWPGLVTRRQREADLFFLGVARTRGLPPAGEDLSRVDIRRGER